MDIEIRLDCNIYLHGLTVHSLNSNFAYYCSCGEYLQCNANRDALPLFTLLPERLHNVPLLEPADHADAIRHRATGSALLPKPDLELSADRSADQGAQDGLDYLAERGKTATAAAAGEEQDKAQRQGHAKCSGPRDGEQSAQIFYQEIN